MPCGPSRPSASRIAVFPLRVSLADTLLGESIAELLAEELGDDGGVTAVHMGTVLRAWRSAGGGARAPLAGAELRAVARRIGAGRAIDGSVIGLRDRVTIALSVIDVGGGRAQRAAPVSGSLDSLQQLLTRLSGSLRATLGGEGRVIDPVALSAVSAANRAYLDGLRAYRRFRMQEAAAAFERAFAEDSTFAAAAYKRFRAAGWSDGQLPQSPWDSTAWALRARLSSADRTLLRAYRGEGPRDAAVALADFERAAALLPESPDAQFALGDFVFHVGGFAGVGDQLERSMRLFERSLALDSQATTLQHLAEAAVLAADTARIRAARPAMEAADSWMLAWVAAGRSADTAWVERLRRRLPPDAWLFRAPALGGLSPAMVDEGARLWLAHVPAAESMTDWATMVRYAAALNQGRPAAARAVLAAHPRTVSRDVMSIHAALFADGDTAAAGDAARRVAASPAESLPDIARCALALWSLARADTAVGETRTGENRGHPCVPVVQLERARWSGAPDLARRAEAVDSAMRFARATIPGAALTLARAWERLGQPRRALQASRYAVEGQGIPLSAVVEYRQQGRYAVLAGDTAAAVRAYRRYLDARRDPEAVLIPQRDSVRAALARLERR